MASYIRLMYDRQYLYDYGKFPKRECEKEVEEEAARAKRREEGGG